METSIKNLPEDFVALAQTLDGLKIRDSVLKNVAEQLRLRVLDALLNESETFSDEELIDGRGIGVMFCGMNVETGLTDNRLDNDATQEEINALVEQLCMEASYRFVEDLYKNI